jgi:hypothetical protein
MTQRALELLTRLAKQDLDNERLALQAVENEIAQRRREVRELETALAVEFGKAWTLPGGPAAFAPYAEACRARQRQLENALARLAQERDRKQTAVHEVLSGYKALDIAMQELRRQAAERLAQRAQAAREEAGLLRLARRSVRPLDSVA